MKKKPLNLAGARPLPSTAWNVVAETAIEASLPPIPELKEATLPSRETVYQALTAKQLAAWVQKHGDPFGAAPDAAISRYELPQGMRQAILASATKLDYQRRPLGTPLLPVNEALCPNEALHSY